MGEVEIVFEGTNVVVSVTSGMRSHELSANLRTLLSLPDHAPLSLVDADGDVVVVDWTLLSSPGPFTLTSALAPKKYEIPTQVSSAGGKKYDEKKVDPQWLDEHVRKSWEWYRAMGSPKYVVAPMVNQSETSFRLMCRKYKADLCYTPMFNSGIFARDATYRENSFFCPPQDRPCFVQFCGDDPDILLTAARYVDGKCDAIDLNLGCPQGIARRGHYGSFLLEEPELLHTIVSHLSANLKTPVTCKIRMLPDLEKTIQLATMLQNSGCSLLTVHGRTKEQNKERVGAVNLDVIKEIKSRLRIPVFANGGIETLEDVKATLEYTKCDGVMSSEGILSNPALFAGFHLDGAAATEEYLDFYKRYPHLPNAIRPHLFKFLHKQITKFTEIRDWISNSSTDLSKVVPMLKEAEAREMEETGLALEEIYENPHWYSRHTTYKVEAPEPVEVEDDGCGLGLEGIFC